MPIHLQAYYLGWNESQGALGLTKGQLSSCLWTDPAANYHHLQRSLSFGIWNWPLLKGLTVLDK